MEYQDILLVLSGGFVGLFSNIFIELFRRRAVNREAYLALRSEIEANIESAENAEMSTYLWSDNIYKANLNHLKLFKPKIKEVVKFYYKIENYKYRYLLYVELIQKYNNIGNEHNKRKTDNTVWFDVELQNELKFTRDQINNENNVLLNLAKEISILGKELI